ncbi:autophagy protein atg9 [Lobulomyces angularis]|nr:autophagy protein atg9 [Lobulomyces angularis]
MISTCTEMFNNESSSAQYNQFSSSSTSEDNADNILLEHLQNQTFNNNTTNESHYQEEEKQFVNPNHLNQKLLLNTKNKENLQNRRLQSDLHFNNDNKYQLPNNLDFNSQLFGSQDGFSKKIPLNDNRGTLHYNQSHNQINESFIEDEYSDDEAPFNIKVQLNEPLLRDEEERFKINDKVESVKCLLECKRLDLFLQRVYKYFTGKGLVSILLAEISYILILSFIVSFSTFLVWCVDHPLIREKKMLSEVLKPQCISNIPILPLAFLIVFWLWLILKVLKLFVDYPLLIEMKNFYNKGLNIQESDLSTLNWATVVNQIVKLKNELDTSRNPPIAKLDAHNIANRILRKENYMISMFNKDVLNLTIPIFGKRKMLTRIIEWSLWICIVDFVFDEHGMIKKNFLRDSNRSRLAKELRQRFILFGFLNLIFSPLLLEYHKNPSSLGTRNYSRIAEWTFREFNELPHLFEERLDRSYESAARYMNQFRKEAVVIIARFITFISGSFAVILTLISLYDQALISGFEITPGGSVLFYIGIFSAVFGAAKGLIPEGHQILDPESIIKEVILETHYFPDEWRDKLHTEKVRDHFGSLFEYNIVLFLAEVLSLAFGPFIFWFSLPNSSEGIIDFFREFTVHVESLGYVCSFAVFDFKRHGNIKYGAQPEVQNEKFVSNQGKMEQSFLDFKAQNPSWEPNPNFGGSMYLSTILSKKSEIKNLEESTLNVNLRKRNMLSTTTTNRRNLIGGGYRMALNETTPTNSTAKNNAAQNNNSNTLHPPNNLYVNNPNNNHLEKSLLTVGSSGGNLLASTTILNPQLIESQVANSEGADFFNLLNDIYESNRQRNTQS